ncbi:4,5-9,10-diseco-3-hydroxy-5,9,17-trioxoandrosta-1 (10),2-diene-4-oate hydrolase [Paractinoplanes deccanensis]|uniref:4,5-9,10-diseco-3-hydroxy-5,9, 17-trioxoandrosta-1 (10),2-diene-4-oate hydrolase n=1 Tax=Paractinoplanes deccanensis TaxID=113561 RepID=A0ABQ3YLJ0_9ACTN|nr:alpha/beta hydrolase [Actinoplanes deccanensis]GID80858.1 4,5-9,10-diseco-3-hydroxy-5,9,17-trioxoandrosta-1 (10),2-diene-4-oate hydrolase [Actinoplanes deccanensis]
MSNAPEGKHAEGYYYLDLGSGLDTVFLHGGGPGCTGWSDFGPVAGLFATDRRVLIPDILQYGRSDKVRITGPMWDFHAARTVALLDSLGVERADFVCNSWGGTIALNLGAKYPDRVRSIVVTGSMPVFYGPLAPLPENGHRGRNARDAYYGGEGPTREKMRHLIASLEWYDGAQLPEETVDMRYQQSLDPGERELAAMSDSPRGDWQDLTAELGRIEAPTLFVWGREDAFLTPDYPMMLARMVPHGNLHVMNHVSHHPQEEQPERYHAIVAAFLADVARRDAKGH